MADAQRGGTGWIAGATVGNQHGVFTQNGTKNSFDCGSADGRQHRTDGGTRPVGGYQNGDHFIRQPWLGCFASTLTGFAIESAFTLAAGQQKGLVGLNEAMDRYGKPEIFNTDQGA